MRLRHVPLPGKKASNNNMDCTGKGECFSQDDYDSYVKEHPCAHECTLKRCPNYIYCGKEDPEWYMDCHGGRCLMCNMTFNKDLVFGGEMECPICLEVKESVQRANCSHSVCIDCFKESFRTEFLPQPECPYDDQEDLPENDPRVMEYNLLYDFWEHSERCEWERRSHLRCCPLCRTSDGKEW